MKIPLLAVELCLILIFFVVGIITLPAYGINWDTINHLPRGQAYLNLFLTGKGDYQDLDKWYSDWEIPWYQQNPQSLLVDTIPDKDNIPHRSQYQIDVFNLKYYIENDGGGHPPLSGILSALFNYVLFQKLWLINDIDAYRVYGVFLATCLLALVYWWTKKVYGIFAGLIAALSLVVYPLFFSEMHFNTEKDLPETVYWSFLLFSIWKGVTTKSWKWILGSGIFFGLALGTKFNILFSVFVIIPWLAFYLFGLWTEKKIELVKWVKDNYKIVLAILAAPIIGLAIFFGSWPYLWFTGFDGLVSVLSFYKEIGAVSSTESRFIWHFGINLYPIKWILYTTPEVILGLFALGIGFVIANLNQRKDRVGLLLLLWLAVPIIRVSLPNTNIYGGVRQIMEFIPALAILTGAGAGYLRNFIARKIINPNVVGLIIIILFIPIVMTLIKIHPNQNVYFNSLIGGLSGAKAQNIPGWGNSFGAAYRQGVVWLNEHAEPNAKVAYARELIPNIPRIWLRRDLNLQNGNRSGYLKQGEYIIALTYANTENTSYFDRYLERNLIPVYGADVDGVSILKIWKNDLEHTRADFLNENLYSNFSQSLNQESIVFDLKKTVSLSRLEYDFSSEDCSPLEIGYVRISDDQTNWFQLPGVMPNEDWSVPKIKVQPMKNHLTIPFTGEKARFIEVKYQPEDACIKNIESVKIYIF